jgi:hypothetical protein
MSILWNTFFREKHPESSRWWLTCLVSHETTPEVSRWGFLGNILVFTTRRQGDGPPEPSRPAQAEKSPRIRPLRFQAGASPSRMTD